MPLPFTRASRDYQFVPGFGGSILLRARNASGPIGGVVTFDIGQYAIKQIYRNKRTNHSGGNGGDLYTRVGAGWTFAAELDFPEDIAPDGLEVPFAETLVGSLRGVAIQFNIGDPDLWIAKGLTPRSYRADKFLAEVIDTTDSSDGESVVGYNIVGVGSSLLGTYLGDELQTPQLWF
jgi:hypothetical protein